MDDPKGGGEDKPTPKSETVLREEEVLAFWRNNDTFQKSLDQSAPKGEYVFYDGPPFATGLPHTGSLLSSVIKDVMPRYKTMRGYHVARRFGWDCHGLPIESLIEKRLGLKTKKDIETVGIDTFNEAARASVMEFEHEWERYIERIGRWVDFKNSYKTMDNSYIESVWWALKELNAKGLLYEGRKVLMYCTHCETPLAKAEIAMDNTYKDVTDEAVTVKFKVKNPKKFNLPDNTYLLAWTTTAWSLPGDVALAVGPEITYGCVEEGGQHLLRAQPTGEFKGKDLVGIEYEPLYDVPAFEAHKGKKYVVVAGDFITADEGTGIGHEAPVYGEDDFALAQKEKLPLVQMLHPNGHYNAEAPEFVQGEYFKKAEKLIKDDLEKRGLLYKREKYTHSYPHCYRCGTPLIYNAVGSWFINIQKVKQKMLAENEKVNWVPAHLKHGRFKHIVENAPDWTISRNRFWASPLPIWKEKGGKGVMVVGSVDELLAKTKRSGNRYFVMRHGLARNNTGGFTDSSDTHGSHVLDEGKPVVRASAAELARTGIDLIITSPFIRTKETAAIVQKELGLPESAVMVDERLREINFGEYDGKPYPEWKDFMGSFAARFTKRPEGGENYADVRRRVGEFLFEIEKRYIGKNILIVSHVRPIWMMAHLCKRSSSAEMMQDDAEYPVQNGEVKELSFVPYPHNKDYEMDLHRPYIDKVVLYHGGKKYERIPEVVDCWVESGGMPFASNHYPFEKKDFNPRRFLGLMPKGYPADFIAEYIAQTRTWFYYMHAMGCLLFGGRAFKNVVSTGTVLAADGSKMSKSKGNYTDPYVLMDKYGADALRLHLMGSVVMQSEDLNFRDDDVKESHNRIVGILWNSYKFYELYKAEDAGTAAAASAHPLDRWIRSRVATTVAEVTSAMDAYELPRAVRSLRTLVEEYSTWYLRRSRERVKGDDKQHALANQREALLAIAKLTAPIAPFIAESIYQGVSGTKESVHLCEWPKAGTTDEELEASMAQVRALASKGLELREKAGIKIRQPLARFTVDTELPGELLEVIKDELNVKEVLVGGVVELATELTPELLEEGKVREIVRSIQEWRKEQGLKIGDRPTYTYSGAEAEVARKYKKEIVAAAGLKSLEINAQ